MECKVTSTRQKGFTLPEVVISLALFVLTAGTLGSMYVHSTRTFVESANYMDFENQSRTALNRMSRTIRQADALTYYSSNKVTFLVGTNFVSFTYYPEQRTLRQETVSTSKALLSDCDYVNYGIYQRNLTNSYDFYPAATLASCKVVQVDWGCSRVVLGKSNTAAAVSAKIVIRKQ